MKKVKTVSVAVFGLAFLLASCSGNATGDDDPQSSSSSLGSSSSVIAGDDPLGVYWNTSISYGTLTDTRDGQTYRTVEMPDGEVWMAENLNYAASGSWCYNNNASFCSTFGRLYDWSTAMGISASYDTSSYIVSGDHQGICPTGWHLPSSGEWSALTASVEYDQIKLKALSGWGWSGGGNGTDDYGFSVLPGGKSQYLWEFDHIGMDSYCWSATEHSVNSASGVRFLGTGSNAFHSYGEDKYVGFSVRCLRD